MYLSAGGNFIYLYSLINQPNLGGRLMQYDTLGNQKWSVALGLMVDNIFADDEGYCYVLCAESGGIGWVKKYDKSGNLVWSSKIPDQYALNACKKGDSLFLCGSLTSYSRVEGQKLSGFSIMSASTGKICYQQTFDINATAIENESFTEVAFDGNNIYIAGTHGNESPVSFLLKLSTSGATGLHENKTSGNITIFLNPGSSRFTITTGNNEVNSMHVTVRNISGQVVYKKQVSLADNNSFTLDLGKQPAGTYSVEVDAGGKKNVKMIVVE
jgi:hypothetical protein